MSTSPNYTQALILKSIDRPQDNPSISIQSIGLQLSLLAFCCRPTVDLGLMAG